MQNPRLAHRYAKSLVDLAVERNELEKVNKEMRYLEQVIKQSKDFAMILKSPVISSEKKTAVFDAVTKDKVGALTSSFLKLLLQKGREINLAEIIGAFIDQYNKIRGIHKVKLTTAVEVSDEVKKAIVSKVKQDTRLDNIELETKVNEALIGGFILEFNNQLLDASVLRDLKDVRAQFQNNDFVQHIR